MIKKTLHHHGAGAGATIYIDKILLDALDWSTKKPVTMAVRNGEIVLSQGKPKAQPVNEETTQLIGG